MSTSDSAWLCVLGGILIALPAYLIGYNFGELQGGKYIIHQLMQKGSVTMVHTEGCTKMIWEVDVTDEKIANDK